MFIVGLIQTIIHYLGWLGIILGIIALVFGNSTRGTELLIGGVVLLFLKYLIGFIYHLFRRK